MPDQPAHQSGGRLGVVAQLSRRAGIVEEQISRIQNDESPFRQRYDRYSQKRIQLLNGKLRFVNNDGFSLIVEIQIRGKDYGKDTDS